MKFYLDDTDDIFLYQLLKAAGLFEEYAHIRRVVVEGMITVNERTVFKQRTKIFPGDTVKYKDEHIRVVAGKEQLVVQRPVEEKVENVDHGKVANWQARPLKKQATVNKDLDTEVLRTHNFLKKSKFKLSLAESCTGGMAGQYITTQGGSSNYFIGGIVSYSNAAKMRLLGVKEKLLQKEGAVSQAVAKAMVEGISELLETDLTGAITGIAGPGTDGSKKPVGTVFIAVKLEEKVVVRNFRFSGNRDEVRRKSCLELFRMLREVAGDKE